VQARWPTFRDSIVGHLPDLAQDTAARIWPGVANQHTDLMVIISAVTAALLAGAFTLLGAALGERRGRKAWARDKRLEASVRLLEKADRTALRAAFTNRGHEASVGLPSSAIEIQGLVVDLLEAQSALILLGPHQLAEASKTFVGTVIDASVGRDGGFETARGGFVRAVQHALRSDPPV
jgi:hypothetical protein